MLEKYYKNENLAEIYYAYNAIHRYLEDPFTSFIQESLFNIARFLLAKITEYTPKGISLLYPSNFFHTLQVLFY